MKKILLILLLTAFTGATFAQKTQGPGTPSLKGNGEVFYLETFDWADPSDQRGWSAPEGFYMEDPEDNGFNWHWWGYDSLVTPRLTREPPMESTSAADGSLCLFADLYNLDQDPRIDLNNSVVFPVMDCSSHSSVIVRFETCFMNYAGAWDMFLEISVDDWVHSAQIDVGFDCGHKGRPNKTVPGACGCGEVDTDSDGDGTANCNDPDDDNDGIPDIHDDFPKDPNEGQDTDEDGIGNNADPDDDNDGTSDEIEDAGPGNGDGNNDGISDSIQNHVASIQILNSEDYCTLERP